jgi:hypothetical protein
MLQNLIFSLFRSKKHNWVETDSPAIPKYYLKVSSNSIDMIGYRYMPKCMEVKGPGFNCKFEPMPTFDRPDHTKAYGREYVRATDIISSKARTEMNNILKAYWNPIFEKTHNEKYADEIKQRKEFIDKHRVSDRYFKYNYDIEDRLVFRGIDCNNRRDLWRVEDTIASFYRDSPVISFGPDDDPEDILKQAKERANLMVNYTKVFYEDWENGVDRVKAEIKEYKNKFNDVELKLKKLI